jgi:hypothetical protein
LRTAALVLSDFEARQVALSSNKPASHTKSRCFNGAVAEPVTFLQRHFCKDLLEILVPPQLHVTLAVNIFVAFLKRLFHPLYEKYILAPKSEGGLGISPCPQQGGDKFAGNECRNILKNCDQLRALAPTRQEVVTAIQSTSPSSSSKSEVIVDTVLLRFEALCLLMDFLALFNDAVHQVTSPKLYDGWSDTFQKMSATFNEFSGAYRKVFPSTQGRSLMSPKIHVLLIEMPEWIRRHQTSLCLVSEQAFEATHHNLRVFRENRNRTRRSKKKPRATAPETLDPVLDQPSDGTRSSAQKKRKAEQRKKTNDNSRTESTINTLFSISPKQSPNSSSSSSSSTSYVQIEEVRCVAAYTRTQFPDTASCYQRLQLAADRYVNKSSSTPPWSS